MSGRDGSGDWKHVVHQAIIDLMGELGDDWREYEYDQLSTLSQQAMISLSWAGLIECRFEVLAWTDTDCVRADCTVRGVWITQERSSVIPDEIRRAMPSWGAKRVCVQRESRTRVRRTNAGRDVAPDLQGDDQAQCLALLYIMKTRVRGSAGVRVLRREEHPGVVTTHPPDHTKLTDTLTAGFALVADAVRDVSRRTPEPRPDQNGKPTSDAGGGTPTEEQDEDAADKHSPFREWGPPEGYVGTKTITLDQRFRKDGKNPPRTTIDAWYAAAKRAGQAPAKAHDPSTHELFLPESWVHERMATWSPRASKPPT